MKQSYLKKMIVKPILGSFSAFNTADYSLNTIIVINNGSTLIWNRFIPSLPFRWRNITIIIFVALLSTSSRCSLSVSN